MQSGILDKALSTQKFNSLVRVYRLIYTDNEVVLLRNTSHWDTKPIRERNSSPHCFTSKGKGALLFQYPC